MLGGGDKRQSVGIFPLGNQHWRIDHTGEFSSGQVSKRKYPTLTYWEFENSNNIEFSQSHKGFLLLFEVIKKRLDQVKVEELLFFKLSPEDINVHKVNAYKK